MTIHAQASAPGSHALTIPELVVSALPSASAAPRLPDLVATRTSAEVLADEIRESALLIGGSLGSIGLLALLLFLLTSRLAG